MRLTPRPLLPWLLILVCPLMARAADEPGKAVAAPPESFFTLVRDRDLDNARNFYRKYVDVGGMPVVAAAEVDDEALLRTRTIVSRMLAGRPDVLAAMVDDGMYLIVIGKDQVYTDMPEYRNHPDPAYQNERVRGTGGKPTSFGEENVLSLAVDRYDDESIAVHEFAHTIDSTLRKLDPEWSKRLDTAYRNAIARGRYRNTYAGSNVAEYWGEIAQSYFDCNRVNNWNHGPVRTREQLKTYDPEGYELTRSTFRLAPNQDWRYTWRQPLPTVGSPPAKLAIDPYYTKFTWAREFTVVGRGASDQALLRANDTIRKLFAYRHDLLKTLIADGMKLVVLGPGETIADLPEYRDAHAKGIDVLARTLDASPETKTLVVAEENVLGDPSQPGVGANQVIQVFARAIHQATATRAVDPNWDRRGRNVQQYEMRVQRLDRLFGDHVATLYNESHQAARWKGTAADRDAVEHWTAGVLAYFDAQGQDSAPPDAAHPIRTREQLATYDPALFALVAETMAYEGKVDWRFTPYRP